MMKRGRQAIARLLTLLMVLPAGVAPSAMTTPRARADVLWRPLPLPRPQFTATTATTTHTGATPIVSRVQPPKVELAGGGSGGNACSSPANAIVAENCLGPADGVVPPLVWDLDPAGPGGLGGDRFLQGYATPFSVNLGSDVTFKIDTVAPTYTIDIYRMGFYGGNGARKIASIDPTTINYTNSLKQPSCATDAATGLVDCGNWLPSATWHVPANAVSGIYFAKIYSSADGGMNHIFFIVRNDASNSDLIYQTSDTTWQAYNNYGGFSLYEAPVGNAVGRAYKVSYNRPFRNRSGEGEEGGKFGWVFSAEYPMVRWLEANGYNISYMSGIDTDRLGSAALLPHKAFISSGHDEYWSGPQRSNVEAARDTVRVVNGAPIPGLHLAFFSGNEVFWKIRWENNYQTMVSYKETHANAKIDPLPEWTGTSRDTRAINPQGPLGTGLTKPENAMTGTLFMVNGEREDSIMVPAAFASHRFWRNTSIATMQPGDPPVVLPYGTLGYEWDEDKDNGYRPAGLQRLSSTTIDVTPRYLLDYGSNYGAGTATHSLTLYRAASGALVFGAGTVQWSWGLDTNHDNFVADVDPVVADQRRADMRQATFNLFADLGVLPGTPAGVIGGTAPSDGTSPTSTIVSPPAGPPTPTIHNGDTLIISGMASDDSALAAVEVSVNGGATWAQASGLSNWTFSWTVTGSGLVTIMSRAIDDSGNIQSPPASVQVMVLRECPCSIWGDSVVPPVPAHTDPQSIQLGMRFRAEGDGVITGIRFYKGTGNDGTVGQPHIGSLWTQAGSLLASAAFTSETATGWQQVTFDAPVPITTGTTYLASYFAPFGHYAIDRPSDTPGPGFTQSITNSPLRALQNGEDGPNGVYIYSTVPNTFPTQTYDSTNYYVDVVFVPNTSVDTTPPFVSSKTPTQGSTGVTPFTTVAARFSESIDATTVGPATFELRDPFGARVPATVSYVVATHSAVLAPTLRLIDASTYTVTVHGGPAGIKDLAGNALQGDVTWSFTTASPLLCPCTIWTPSTAPPFLITNFEDGQAIGQGIELGVKFRSDADGYISGVRFYKTLANVAPHTVTLWDMSGNALANATTVG